MSVQRDKVLEVFINEDKYDSIYMQDAEMHDGEHYMIFDDWDSLNKFVAFTKEVLELDEEERNIEGILETNFVFSDEYTTCSDCGHVIRTSPDSYSWQPDFYVGDGFIACNECFNDNSDYQEAYIEEKINDPSTAINGLISEQQLEELGFTKLDADYQDGWYDRHDDPKAILANLEDRYAEVLFFVDGVGQFHVDFGVFVRGEYETEEE